MSIREDLWDYIGDATVSRSELIEAFGAGEALRKSLYRMKALGELVQHGDSWRRGTRAETAFRPWGEDELAVLRAYAHEGFDALSERLPGRTRVAIKQKAETLKVGPKLSAKPAVLNLPWPAFTRGNLSPVVQTRWAA